MRITNANRGRWLATSWKIILSILAAEASSARIGNKVAGVRIERAIAICAVAIPSAGPGSWGDRNKGELGRVVRSVADSGERSQPWRQL